jgi:Uncharacterized conserved protein (COG2071)
MSCQNNADLRGCGGATQKLTGENQRRIAGSARAASYTIGAYPMIKYPNNPMTRWSALAGSKLSSIRQGNVSVNADLQHLSLIVYAIPIERVEEWIPFSLQIEESAQKKTKVAWLSIISFMDHVTPVNGQVQFEQTSYRLQIKRDKQPASWLLGISLGSLAGVATRNLWPMPWHLSAMEFDVSYNRDDHRYNNYRLQTQSQWVNANWEISDSGEKLSADRVKQLKIPASLYSGISDNYFMRRDDSLGLYRTHYHGWALNQGELKSAKCDLLEGFGLLTRDELKKPALVAIQHRVSCQIFSPTIIRDSHLNSSEYSVAETRFAFAT